MSDVDALLQAAARRANRYLDGLSSRRVSPSPEALEGLTRLALPLPDRGLGAEDVLRLLDEAGSPATMASAGPRFFGFVIGGALPAALAANWLAGPGTRTRACARLPPWPRPWRTWPWGGWSGCSSSPPPPGAAS